MADENKQSTPSEIAAAVRARHDALSNAFRGAK